MLFQGLYESASWKLLEGGWLLDVGRCFGDENRVTIRMVTRNFGFGDDVLHLQLEGHAQLWAGRP